MPDINLANSSFTPIPNLEEKEIGGKIVFGLSAIRNVGDGLVDLIVR